MHATSSRTDFATAFARLLSDAACREQFRADRDTLARELGLNADDRAVFTALDIDDLERQAYGLIDKRLREVARLIPASWIRLHHETATELFREYASTNWPTGHRRHVDDALAFGRWLIGRGRHDICRAELNFLAFSTSRRAFSTRFVRRADIAGTPRCALQILYRWRGKPHNRFFYLRT